MADEVDASESREKHHLHVQGVSNYNEETEENTSLEILNQLNHSDHHLDDIQNENRNVRLHRKKIISETSRGRYRQVLQKLKPFRKGKCSEQEFPGGKVGWVSYVTVKWLDAYMWRFYRKKTIDHQDLWDCPPELSCKVNSQRFERLWAAEVRQKGLKDASLGWTVWRFVQTRIIMFWVLQIVMLTFSFIGPTFLLKALLDYTEDPETDLVYGLLLVLALFCTECMRCVILVGVLMMMADTGVRVRTAVVAIVYHKILKLRSLQDKSVGELVNLCANDAQRIFLAVATGPSMFAGPIIGLAATVYIWTILGPWALLATTVFMLYYPYQMLISRATLYFRRRAIVITDRRVRLMNEILTCIKLIKLYAWEKPFAKAVAVIRARECHMLEKLAFVNTMSISFAPIMPVFAAVVTFTIYTSTGNDLTATQAFVTLGILGMLRYRMLGVVAGAVKNCSEAMHSIARVKGVLAMEEIQSVSSVVSSPELAIEISSGNFAWDLQRLEGINGKTNTAEPCQESEVELEKLCMGNSDLMSKQHTQVLYDINIKIPKGQLYAVCGSVGSGKSSLISAILGQMIKLGGTVGVSGSIAYVSQQAWVMNASLRDNILFGQSFQQERYAEVLKHCCLEADLKALPAGDMTEIGERGINLSGGQKQRVSLARAVYAQRDVYFLDDPLSAVDVHVGKYIFENVLKGLLQGKTIFFNTHQLQYLPECDYVAFIKNGYIQEEGCHDDLMHQDGLYASLIKHFYERSDDDEDGQIKEQHHSYKKTSKNKISTSCENISIVGSITSLGSVASDEINTEDITTDGHLVEDEELEKGSVSTTAYTIYMRSAGGFFISTFVILTFVVPVGITAFSSMWLAYWVQQQSGNTTAANGNWTLADVNISDNAGVQFYTLVYGMTAVALVLSLCIRGFIFMKTSLKASNTLHDKVFSKVLHSPMSFFDTTPVGRIINRFAKDMDEVDVLLPARVELLVQNLLSVFASLVMISVVFPWFLVAVVPLAALFWFVNVIFSVVLREGKRLDGVTRSPVYSWLTASLQGLHLIHAYDKTGEFLTRFFHFYDQYTMVYHFYQMTLRWVSVRLNLMVVLVNTITAAFVVVTKGQIPTALAGLALSYASQLTGMFQLTVRMKSETEAHFVSVERIYHYIKNVASEASTVIADYMPPVNWPQEGAISYNKYKVRYRKGLPLVLKGISCHIKSQEKVGIVGRTGSGKSSLALSVFRLMEPASGTIAIDGIDISNVGLDDLRSSLSIIPQDPVLFIGTIRYNLDPFNLCTDQELWVALQKCHMKETILRLEGQLQAAVIENGENFSVGERQLLCITRVLLRHSKILILDEATAAIDTETDALIQATIREVFADCTLLTIAHRLHTIMDSDRIMVLQDGKIVEFDEPQILLSNPSSHFSAMLKMDR